MTENFNSWNCSRCGGAPILFDERGVCQKCHDASEFAKTVEAEMGKAISAMIKSFNKAGIHGGGFPDYCPPEHDEAIELQRMLDLRESQLADCTRVMREVSIEMDGLRKAIDNRVVEANSAAQIIQACVQKLDAAHAGKVGA